MSQPEIIDAEGMEVEVRSEPAPALFQTDDPVEIFAQAKRRADVLAKVVQDRQLFKNIGRSQHVFVEAWTAMGVLNGVFPITVWTRRIDDGEHDGWEARVEARTLGGQVVGAAESECLRSESKWENSDDYAIRSMAQTRATSKALRQPLGWIMVLAGYNPTPAEEIPETGGDDPQQQPDERQTQEQRDQLSKLVAEIEQAQPKAEGQESYWKDVQRFAVEQFGVDDSSKLTFAQMEGVIAQVESWSIPL